MVCERAVFPGTTDTQAFQTYVDEVLAPELRPGDVVVFDNLKPHRSPHVAESIGRAGASVLPLPPYNSLRPDQEVVEIKEISVTARARGLYKRK